MSWSLDDPWLACKGWPDHPCRWERCLVAETCQRPDGFCCDCGICHGGVKGCHHSTLCKHT